MMKKFLRKVLLFSCIPAALLILVEVLTPPAFFTHRTWETISFQSFVPRRSYFYPNVHSEMYAVGDLCHHTEKAVVKKEVWITDKLGFRNEQFIEEPDVIFIGDSFIAGSGLSQDETISSSFRSAMNNKVKVYNMAPATLSSFEYYYRSGIIKKPKLIIYSISERNVPRPIEPFDAKKFNFKSSVKGIFETGGLNVLLDKALKGNSIHWLKARFHQSKGAGVPAGKNADMFFYSGNTETHAKTDIEESAKVIISYKNYCDSLGIEFLFMPMPDKETVYFELVPFNEQPAYLHRLDSILTNAGVATIHTLDIYNKYRKTNSKLLYHLDDSHWNPNGTALVSKEIARKLCTDMKHLAVKWPSF